MKKINIQRDLESRRNMMQAFSQVQGMETEVETIKKEESDAESKETDGKADHTGAGSGAKAKKGRRTSPRDV